MSEQKVQCRQCGAKILVTTSTRTGGVCMPCKNAGNVPEGRKPELWLGGGAPEWRRRQLWLKHGADPLANIPWYRSPWSEEILTTCRKLISGELGSIEGSQRMAELSEIVLHSAHGDKWLHKDWEVFFEGLGSTDSKRNESFDARVRSAASKLLEDAEKSLRQRDRQ